MTGHDKGHFDLVLLVLLLPEMEPKMKESSDFFMLKLDSLSATSLKAEKRGVR